MRRSLIFVFVIALLAAALAAQTKAQPQSPEGQHGLGRLRLSDKVIQDLKRSMQDMLDQDIQVETHVLGPEEVAELEALLQSVAPEQALARTLAEIHDHAVSAEFNSDRAVKFGQMAFVSVLVFGFAVVALVGAALAKQLGKTPLDFEFQEGARLSSGGVIGYLLFTQAGRLVQKQPAYRPPGGDARRVEPGQGVWDTGNEKDGMSAFHKVGEDGQWLPEEFLTPESAEAASASVVTSA